ncbi:MAG: hypothetical protein PHE84_10515 [bacterium]|nr:hypothetical protein [bacterium]
MMKILEVSGYDLKVFRGLIHGKANDKRLEHIAMMIEYNDEIKIICRDFFDSEVNNICISFPLCGCA